MKYFVIAVVWSSAKQKCVRKIMGIFDEFRSAEIFRNAYNDIYCADAEIVELGENQ